MNLEQFLDREREGGTSAGQGSFTIAIEKARLKLQKYLLSSREDWIKKLIQAVSAWRVRKLEVKQTREHTTFHFQPSLRYGLPSGSDILKTLLAAEVEGRDPLNRFCQALHSIRELEKLSYYLAIHREGSEPMVYHDGPHTGRAAPRRSPMAGFTRMPGITLAVSHRTDEEKRSLLSRFIGTEPVKRLMADLSYQIWRASLAAPIKIVLDGSPLQRLKLGPSMTVPLVRGVPPVRRGDPLIVLPPFLLEHFQGEDVEFAGYFLLRCSSSISQGSVFHFVDDGAVLERLLLPNTTLLSLEVFVNSQGLPTALDGLSLIPSGQRKERLANSLAQVEASLERAAEKVWDWNLPPGVSGETVGLELQQLLRGRIVATPV